jgi:single-strand DNA-binding protein
MNHFRRRATRATLRRLKVTSFDCHLISVWLYGAINNQQSPNGEKGQQTMKTNQFELSGFIGNTPDVRFTPNGKAVATFSLYTRERWTDAGGEAREKTQRHQITAWGAQAEIAQRRLEKGTRVQIVGRIDQQSWGESEQRQYKTVLVATEIVLVGFAAPEEAPTAEVPESAEIAPAEVAPEPSPEPKPRRRRAKQAASVTGRVPGRSPTRAGWYRNYAAASRVTSWWASMRLRSSSNSTRSLSRSQTSSW